MEQNLGKQQKMEHFGPTLTLLLTSVKQKVDSRRKKKARKKTGVFSARQRRKGWSNRRMENLEDSTV